MASGKAYLQFILEQLSDLDDVSYCPMMGEFILYYRGKIVGGIYDDRLLVKKTRSALNLMPAAICELPYDGAKEMLPVDGVDSKEFLTKLFIAMYDELPLPKLKIDKENTMNQIYPRPHDKQTVYLKDVVTGPNIEVGNYTIYNDFVHDPRDFEKNNVLYHYPINGDRLIIGKFCSVACGAKFMFTSGNHSMQSLSTYTFPIFFDEWGLNAKNICQAWDNKGDIVIGNDVWIGYEAVIMSGVKIGNGAIIGTRAVVTKECRPIPLWAVCPQSPSAAALTMRQLRSWKSCAGGIGTMKRSNAVSLPFSQAILWHWRMQNEADRH